MINEMSTLQLVFAVACGVALGIGSLSLAKQVLCSDFGSTCGARGPGAGRPGTGSNIPSPE